jgi:hypothetical protein
MNMDVNLGEEFHVFLHGLARELVELQPMSQNILTVVERIEYST